MTMLPLVLFVAASVSIKVSISSAVPMPVPAVNVTVVPEMFSNPAPSPVNTSLIDPGVLSNTVPVGFTICASAMLP